VHRPPEVATDPAESIDAHADGHGTDLLIGSCDVVLARRAAGPTGRGFPL
jgi:hypothetical protein